MKTKRIFLLITGFVLAFGLIGASIIPGCDNTSDGGVFKSTDGGTTWEQKVAIDGKNSLKNADVLSLAVNPQDTNIIYAGVQGDGLFKTTDGGDTWREVLPVENNIYAITLDPKDPNIVYAAAFAQGNGKIYKSPNGFEETSEEALIEAQGELALVDIVVDHFDTSKIYVVAEEGGIFKSSDFGETWTSLHWQDGELSSVTMSPDDSRVLYVGTGKDGVLKTTDGGETWTEIEEQLEEFDDAEKINDIVAISSETVYAATDHSLLKTSDGGATWEVVNTLVQPGEVPIGELTINPALANVIYFTTGTAIHKSINSGETWSNWLLPTEREVSSMVIDPENQEILYTGVLKPKK